MKNIHSNRKGWLTEFSLACGFIESVHDNKKGLSLRLWRDSGPAYHVRLHDHENAKRIEWNTFTRLTEARKDFSRLCREYKLKRKVIKVKP